ncbi:HAMP domain-containing sensor histidine kinase [Ureibacillus terrenus]|uniref:HAMP domain-containing sensor histidine kinase n=1 Tax=Ureibacillus terrenus TaxID=118246 RepID=UPI002E2002DF|nr:HAMP domain-containing sensor histidine kinase [Ureibacillus terrenus]
MENKMKLLLSLFLISWILFSLYLLISYGPRYAGKSYFDSVGFEENLERFKNGLERYVLEPFDAEEAKKHISVTQKEIEHHRYYYGSLTDQIEDIKSQYQERIDGAANDEELQKLLIEERDQKIEDIRKNFSDDRHVEEKVRKQKEEIIDKYAALEKEGEKSFLEEFNYFAYHLQNVETGETFQSGDVDAEAVFTESFGDKGTYLVVNGARTIDPDGNEANGMFEYDHTLMDPEIRIPGQVSRYEGIIAIPKTMMNNAYFQEDFQNFNITKMILYVIWAIAIFALAGLLTVAKPSLGAFSGPIRLKEYFLKLPIDLRIGTTLMAILFMSLSFDAAGNIFPFPFYADIGWLQYGIELVFKFLFIFIFTSLSILGTYWTWESANTEEKMKEEWRNSFLYRLSDGIQDLFLERPIGIQAIVVLSIVFLAGFGFAVLFMEPTLILVYAPLLLFIGLPAITLFLKNAGYLNRIMKQTEEMAEGRLTAEVEVKGKSPLAKHARHLNELQEGVRKSMMEQAKSERLKTELITNVSHDLRTPLTSIITYTDLLKNPEITEEERKRYIDILENKSQRLKTLIEDLFEVSKMSSGNVELKRERIDLTQLLQQAVGEHKEDFEQANLDLRVTLPDEPLYAYVDGQKWWRMIDNLIVNALKYSLNGTRVYVSLKKAGSAAEFTVKNIANYELGDNVEELTERFKRADESRHTEGSGLGLAIAQSIVELHHGKLEIGVDGDLFKVVVTVAAE